MLMDTTETGRLCKKVEQAAAQVSTSFSERASTSELLHLFLCLQDSLSLLIEAVNREQGDVTQCRSLIRKVVNILESPQVRDLAGIHSLMRASGAVNESLIKLEQATQRSRAAGAG